MMMSGSISIGINKRQPGSLSSKEHCMIVSEIMTTSLVTVAADDTLSHAANLLRQFQIHQLPVVRQVHTTEHETWKSLLLLEGLLTLQDIDVAMAVEKSSSSSDLLQREW